MYKIMSLSKAKLLSLMTSVLLVAACNTTDNSSATRSQTADPALAKNKQTLILFNEKRLEVAKKQLKAKNPLYVKAYKTLLIQAKKELKKPVDPVTNKTLLAASGDIHDYHSINPYCWPNPDTPDGMPWVYVDGKYNREVGNGSATDYNRRRSMLTALDRLTLAFYFSEDMAYLKKAKEIVKTWFVDEATRMNPNVNFGSSYPGTRDGSAFGILQWNKISSVINAVQFIEMYNLWGDADSQTMQQWFNDYYVWITTSPNGVTANTRKNNHGSNYDYQVISLQLYLGKIEEAEAQIDITKTRIDSQLAADGSQPHELKRTKSVNYTVNNLWALTRVADLSRRHTNNDLWEYTDPEGVGLKTAFEFVVPYFTNPSAWKWKQATGGGVEKSLQNLALPRFHVSQLMLGVKVLPDHLDGSAKFKPEEVLMYAP